MTEKKSCFLPLLLSLLSCFFTTSGYAESVALIEQPAVYSRVITVSDTHGMFENLKKLLLKNRIIDPQLKWSAGKTLLVVLGDSIDKGPNSIDILDLWIALGPEAEKAGGRLLVMAGNHEAEFLANPENDKKAEALYADLNRKGIPVRDLTDPSTPRGSFLRNLPIAARIGKWFFSHSGRFPTDLSWTDFRTQAETTLKQGNYSHPLISDAHSVLKDKEWWRENATRKSNLKKLVLNGFTGVVFGHQPKAFGVSKRLASALSGKAIKTDTGMAPDAGGHPGQLLEFPNPSELTTEKSPRIYSLDHQGNREAVIEAYTAPES